MKVGFIGAGNVGSCLGQYFVHNNITVTGYYSRTKASAQEAASRINGQVFSSIDNLLTSSDVLFLTVPDGAIEAVWEQVRTRDIKGKFICHCSGSYSSTILSGSEDAGAYGYSIHPMFPFNRKTITYEDIHQAVFSVEGNAFHKETLLDLLTPCGNKFISIHSEDKTKYHAAAVFASNLMVGLMEESIQLLEECGFTRDDAYDALKPLATTNLDNIFKVGTKEALTGPVDRNDIDTVKNHLDVLEGRPRKVYQALTDEIIDIAANKHPHKSYEEMREGVRDETNR